MDKHIGLIAGITLTIGGLVAYNKAKTDKVNLEIKEDIGDKTLAGMVSILGVIILIREVVKNK